MGIVVALVVVNILLVAMLFYNNTPQAQGQTMHGGNDYVMITGRTESGVDAVYIIDLKTRKMGAWRFDRNAKKMMPYRGTDLKANFGGR